MGIQDRDYMKRRSDDGDRRPPSGTGAENFLTGFLERHPRFFLYVGIGLGALIVIPMVAALLSKPG